MPTQLPSGRWRPRVRHPRTHKQLNPRAVIGGPESYPSKQDAAAAEAEALRLLRLNARVGATVREWWTTWTTDPLWQRPSESTMIHYAERTRGFVDAYGHMPIRAVGDEQVAAWIQGGRNLSTIPKLKTMWSDAASMAAGRLVDGNPWTGLRLPKQRKVKKMPPDVAAVARMLDIAVELTPPSFAAWLAFGCYQGTRPGETDALRRPKIDFQAETVLIDEQWNRKTRSFTEPKHGSVRLLTLTEPAGKWLLRLPPEPEFVFTTLNGTHYTPSSRQFHWERVRCAAGLGKVRCYDATRHFFGWYAWNVLGLADHVIARHLGHQDGGKLVREVYGHADQRIARDLIREAFRTRPADPILLSLRQPASTAPRTAAHTNSRR